MPHEAITFELNGVPVEVRRPGRTRLAHALRNELGRTGTRLGCTRGVCGACTVVVDGAPELACLLPIDAVTGKSVRTIERLAGETLHPLVQAVVDAEAAQCGYCLAGIVMAALPLYEAGGLGERDALARALGANLCRCGAHSAILDALQSAERM